MLIFGFLQCPAKSCCLLLRSLFLSLQSPATPCRRFNAWMLHARRVAHVSAHHSRCNIGQSPSHIYTIYVYTNWTTSSTLESGSHIRAARSTCQVSRLLTRHEPDFDMVRRSDWQCGNENPYNKQSQTTTSCNNVLSKMENGFIANPQAKWYCFSIVARREIYS